MADIRFSGFLKYIIPTPIINMFGNTRFLEKSGKEFFPSEEESKFIKEPITPYSLNSTSDFLCEYLTEMIFNPERRKYPEIENWIINKIIEQTNGIN